MNKPITRRSILASAGSVAVCGSVASRLLSAALAAEAQQSGTPEANISLSMVFMAGRKAKFESRKYISDHMPLLRRIYGDSVERIELRTTAVGLQGVPAQTLAATNLWVRDLRGFIQRLQAGSAEINADLAKVSKGDVVAQTEKSISASGDARATLDVNTHVISTYFRGRPGGKFDVDYYTSTYIPKMYSLYGLAALRRLEATHAAPELGNASPMLLAGHHLYVRDRSAYDGAAREANSEMMRDNGKFTDLLPMFEDMRIAAIG